MVDYGCVASGKDEKRRAFDEQEVNFSGFSMNFYRYYFMYFALSVVTGFQRDNGCGAAGSGEGVLIRRVKGCVKNFEIVFL